MSTNGDAGTLCPVHHDGRVPAHPRAVGSLNLLIARKLRLVLRADGVDVVSGWHKRNI